MLRTIVALGVLILLFVGSLWFVHQVDVLGDQVPLSPEARRPAPTARVQTPSKTSGEEPEPARSDADGMAPMGNVASARTPLSSTQHGSVPRGAVLAGTVRVLGEGAPAALTGATVRLVIEGEGELAATTSEGGHFRFDSLPAGRAALSARGIHEPEGEPLFFSLEGDEEREDLVLDLAPGVRLEGEILESVANRADRRVVARPLEGLERWVADVDETGRFTMYLAPGLYRVFLDWSPQSGAPDDFIRAYAERCERQVVIRPGIIARVVLGAVPEGAIAIDGTVRSGGAPVAGVILHVLPETEPRPITMARTAADGSFHVVVPEPGPIRFAVGEDPSTQVLFQREIPAQASYQVDLLLPSASLSGRVQDPDGTPVPEISVLLTPMEERVGSRKLGVVRRATTDDEGRWRIEFLPAGSYRLRFGGVGVDASERLGVRILRDVELTDGEGRNGILTTLPIAAKVRVRVVDRSGSPIPGVRVLARDPGGLDFRIWAPEIRTDEGGWATLSGLGTGRVTILAELGERRARKRLPLAPGGDAELQITLP